MKRTCDKCIHKDTCTLYNTFGTKIISNNCGLYEEIAHWIKEHNKHTCSACSYTYWANNDNFNYCPNCEAKMKGYQEPDERLQPKKVNQIYSDYNGAGACGYCPNCGKGVIIKNTFVYKHRIKKGHFCEWCGQSLDWGEEPFRNIGSFKSLLLTIKEYIKQDPLIAFLQIVLVIHIILVAIFVFT